MLVTPSGRRDRVPLGWTIDRTQGVLSMGASTSRSGLARLLAAVLLIVLMLASAVPVGASDDEEGSGIGMDALAGLGLDEGGGEPEQSPTGDLNDPLAGGSGGSSEGGDTEETSSEPGTDQGSDPVDPATSETNPMFKLMLDLILEDVQAAEAEAKAVGKTLTEAQRSAVAVASVKDLVAFLQQTGLLGEVDTRELIKQIEAIPAGSE